jgi:hypothetical protein
MVSATIQLSRWQLLGEDGMVREPRCGPSGMHMAPLGALDWWRSPLWVRVCLGVVYVAVQVVTGALPFGGIDRDCEHDHVAVVVVEGVHRRAFLASIWQLLGEDGAARAKMWPLGSTWLH